MANNEKTLVERVNAVQHNWKQGERRVGNMPLEKGKTYSINITSPFDEDASYDAFKTIEGANISVSAFCRRGNGLDFERKPTMKETVESLLLAEANAGNELITFTVVDETSRRSIYNGEETLTRLYTLQRA